MMSHRHFDPGSEHLVRRHLPLVRALAQRHAGRGESLEDLVQVASLALVTAARRFDPDRGVPFAAYAAPTIDGELRRHLRDRVAVVRVPRRDQETATLVRRAGGAVSQRLGHEPSLVEAAGAAGIPVDEARRALAASRPSASLDLLAERASAAAEEAIDACELRALIQASMQRLAPRERSVVELRFGADLSQAEIGRRLHISQSQASRLLAGALDKLRRDLGDGLGRAA
jgi:RNA polymerase sigma-B factor